mmetsp:Transcript_40657/g.88861  ORF Transcript_40657/g.88861 Transcript_40657/m.88861 type:complete len:177 (-) Transcript_40657:171-701(-)
MQLSLLRSTLLAVGFYVVAGGKLFLHSKSDDCGKGFDSLNEGSQKYFDTLKVLWSHPSHLEQFGVFEAELKCWFSYMLTTKCGGLSSQADSRKKMLTSTCKDSGAGWMPIWKSFTKEEVDWFKRSYPNDEADSFATADYRASAATAMELNKKEMLCMTLFVIDDNCVDSMYIRTNP